MYEIFSKKNLRIIATILLFAYIILLFVNPVHTEEDADKSIKKIKQLQIGIKKKVPDCVKKASSNDVLHIHYTGKLLNGEVFDSSLERGDPLSFTLGTGQVIKGWDRGLIGICEGEKRILKIPSDLAYGERGAGKIPSNSDLIFEVECVKIESKKEDL